MTNTFLFLDDIREPEQAFEYTKNDIYIAQKWQVVRNFYKFKSHIEANGLPKVISFDHDLAPSHYTPEHLWTDYNKSKDWQDAQVHTDKTGYDCAVWLVVYCKEKSLRLPYFYCHSMNPVGKDKILRLLNEFKNSQLGYSKPR